MQKNRTQHSQCDCHLSEAELLNQLDEVLIDYKDQKGGLIPALQVTQGLFGYLPEAALKKIALIFNKPYSEVTGVVTFYSFFTTIPKGKFTIRVCMGTTCYVRGGKEVLKALEEELEIAVGQTTKDRLFSLEVGRCFGACGLAPAVMVNDETHQRVRPNTVATIVQHYRELRKGGRNDG